MIRQISSLLALLIISAPAVGQVEDQENDQSPGVLEEVIVTARKIGAENTLFVPMSTSVITADIIDKRDLQGMDDYLRYQPGTNYVDRGVSRNSAIIRGITADPGRGGAIAGIYIDETPVQGLGFAGGSPDLKLVDVERAEVLRGPQGTLYGGGSMSGTVRTLTRAPNTGAFDGEVKLGGSQTSGDGDFNYEAQAMVNLPLGDEHFAFRAVVYRFENSGYVENVASTDPVKLQGGDAFGARLSDRPDERGNSEIDGYRLSALWHVSDRLDIRLTAMGQEIDQDGFPTTDALQGPFEQSRYARLDGSDENLFDDLELYSLLIEYNQQNWSLLSSTSWTDYEYGFDWDVGLFFLDALGGQEPPYWLYQAGQNEVFTEELRWVWDAGGRWRLLVGGYYEDRSTGFDQVLNFEGDPSTDPFGGLFNSIDRTEDDVEQISVFADLTLELGEQWEATVGGRHFDFDQTGRGVFLGEASESSSSESGDTWKAGINWRPKGETTEESPLVYVLWSQGFRPGHPVAGAPPRCDPDGDGVIDEIGLPFKDIESDEIESLEVGYKTEFAQQRVSLQTAVFDISWDGIPIEIPVPDPCAFTLPFNAGSAESQGIEFVLSALLTDRLKLDLTGSWVDAELTEDAPGLGLAGDRLPGSPKFNAALGIEYDFDWREYPGWVRGDVAWVGDYYSTLQETQPKLGDYTTLDFSAGLDVNSWTIEIFVKNLTDSDELTWANPIWAPYPRGSVLRPRTIGARFAYRFGHP